NRVVSEARLDEVVSSPCDDPVVSAVAADHVASGSFRKDVVLSRAADRAVRVVLDAQADGVEREAVTGGRFIGIAARLAAARQAIDVPGGDAEDEELVPAASVLHGDLGTARHSRFVDLSATLEGRIV